ncbi:hypothetical protein GCM10010269_13620 [Streptomyces humidus]|uniref:Uncharacterized protein n=1 Tax=Streptomyces humidus TaxID=52259 RepID=A0A918L1N4_9ACTN|nr:hypothetical protein [Streptomyces humidus]GGR75662.1 hypothetical protein GCM10010269_13620 [Streptomyces humidus]
MERLLVPRAETETLLACAAAPAPGSRCGGCVQLRLGLDIRWYPCLREDDGAWWPAAPANSDPVTALTAARSQNGG